MIKKLLSLFLLIPASNVLASPNMGYMPEPLYYNYHDPIDYGAIKRITEQELDRYFQPHSLPSSMKSAYARLKKQALNEIPGQVNQLCSDHTTAKSVAKQLAQDYAISFVVTVAREIADMKLSRMIYNAPVNPHYINKNATINVVVDIIRSQAYMELSAHNGKLDKLMKYLSDNVETLLRQELERYY